MMPPPEQQKITVGSRSSRLARVQVDEVFSLLARTGKTVTYTLTTYATQGDLDKKTPLTQNIYDNFFTDALDQALVRKEIDVAVHSAKDLPQRMPDELEIFALTTALDNTDAFIGRASLSALPRGSRVGSSSVWRQERIMAINPDVAIVDIRGDIEERIRLYKEGRYDGIIVATCALRRLGLEREITETLPGEGVPLQGQMAVVGRRGDEALKRMFSAVDVRKIYGKVFLVGAGPGDPELITLKAIKALQKADTVFYDYLINDDLLLSAPQAEKVYVGKRKGSHSLSQETLCRLLRDQAVQGKQVVRLKGGDPLIFGRGAEEIEYLRARHIDVEVIPGVSSATGIPSSLGVPLTARGLASSVAFVSGHGEDESSTERHPLTIPSADTLIFLMGLTRLTAIVDALRTSGRDEATPVMIVSHGTRGSEKIVSGTIRSIVERVAREPLLPPALIVVGDVVKFWKERRTPGEKVLYLGTNPQHYAFLGDILHHPMIEIQPAAFDKPRIQAIVQSLPGYDLIVFTSRFAVKYFFQTFVAGRAVCSQIQKTPCVAIGQNTAEFLRLAGVNPALVAQEETGPGLVRELTERMDLKGKKIFFPRSSLPNPYLREALTVQGSEVTEVAVYRNVKPVKRDFPVPVDQIKKIFFTSPSTVDNFLADYGRIPAQWHILSKGPTTQSRLKAAGYESDVLLRGA